MGGAKIQILSAITDMATMITLLRIERDELSELFDDLPDDISDEYADRVQGYCDRVAEILLDIQDLNAEKLKGERE